MEKTEIRSIQFLVSGKDPPEMLNLIDETFHQMTLAIPPFIVFPLRYFPPIVALKKLLDDGPLGRPFVVNAEIVMGEKPANMPEH